MRRALRERLRSLQVTDRRAKATSQAADAWLALLVPVSNYDVIGDKTRKLGRTLMIVGFILLFVNIFFNRRSSFGNLLFWVLDAMLLLSGVMIYWKTKKLDLQLDLRRFVLPVLTVLREDMPPGTPLQLNMDLRGGTLKEKLVREGDPYSRGVYHKVVDSFFTDPWMEGRALLIDGSRIHWKIIDRIRQSRKTKRTARGKTKSKTKTKQKTHLLVEVGLPGKRYELAGGGDGAPVQPQTEITVRPGDKRSTVKVHRVIQSEATSALGPGHFLEAISEAFKRAVPNPSKG
jgi:hypothetical protein